LDEAIGSGAIINGPDIRLGIDAWTLDDTAEVIIRGFEREEDDEFSPIKLKRIFGDDGKPIAYGVPVSLAINLNVQDRTAWDKLPEGDFQWEEIAKAYGGNSVKMQRAFKDRCVTAGVLRQVRHGIYRKLVAPITIATKRRTNLVAVGHRKIIEQVVTWTARAIPLIPKKGENGESH